jgi:predicted deacetylase
VGAEYILRLDDACPTWDRRRWLEVESLVRRHGVKPIAAVVPANEDPALVRGSADEGFWERARAWQDAGWMIALHGFSHALRRSRGGLVPVNLYSEFVGLSAEEQKHRIKGGVKALESRGLVPKAWVAPAHGMDLLTLEALRTESGIQVISDSFSRRVVRRRGFTWIPQQLWRPRAMGSGLWTICLHPNEMDGDGMNRLDAFLSGHWGSFADPKHAASRAVPYGLSDALFNAAFLAALRIRRRRAERKM